MDRREHDRKLNRIFKVRWWDKAVKFLKAQEEKMHPAQVSDESCRQKKTA